MTIHGYLQYVRVCVHVQVMQTYTLFVVVVALSGGIVAQVIGEAAASNYVYYPGTTPLPPMITVDIKQLIQS